MPNFAEGGQEWSGGFAPVRPIPKTNNTNNAIAGAIAQMAPTILQGLGAGYAAGEGSAIRGEGVTAVEAERSVAGYQESTANVQGLTNAEIVDMKAAALKKYGTDDKRLQALVSSGQITTLEANARRQSMLQEHLSNPVLAMFKDDFMQAAAPYTGGTGNLAKQFFGAYQPSEEEIVQMKVRENAIEDATNKETAVQQLMSTQGMSREDATQYYFRANKEAMAFKEAKRNFESLKYGSPEVYQGGVSFVNSFFSSVNGQIATMVQKGGSLTPDQITGLKGSLTLSRDRARRELEKFGSKMTTEDYNSLLKRFSEGTQRLESMLSDQSQLKALEGSLAILDKKTALIEGGGKYQLVSAMPVITSAYAVDPKLGELLIDLNTGDLSAKYKATTNPYWNAMVNKVKHMDLSGVTNSAYDKIFGNGRLDESEQAGFALSLVDPTAAQAIPKAMKSGNESSWRDAFEDTFSQKGNSLSIFTNRDSWTQVLNSKDGEKIAIPAFRGAIKNIRSQQMVSQGNFPPSIAIREVLDTVLAQYTYGTKVNPVSFELDTGGVKLDDGVKRELVQMYKIVKKNPTLLKSFGVETIDELLTKVFTTGLK